MNNHSLLKEYGIMLGIMLSAMYMTIGCIYTLTFPFMMFIVYFNFNSTSINWTNVLYMTVAFIVLLPSWIIYYYIGRKMT